MTDTTNTATDTTVATTVVATPAAAVPAVPKAPSKKSQADAIFAAKLVERSQGLFADNKSFRAAVLTAIQTDLSVTLASAATMYNAAKKAAETADATVALGRDPKKEKPAKVEGAKRGRPAGSKNKAKEAVVVDPNAQPVVDVVTGPATEVANVIAVDPVAAEAAPAEAEAAA